MSAAAGVRCANCGTEIVPGLLSCPACGALVHAERLKSLAADAEQAEGRGNLTAALAGWREILNYLPSGTRQRESVQAKVASLSARVETRGPAGSPWWKRAGALGPVGVAAAFLGKAKFLLLGFGKIGTLFSFLAGFAVYWTLWGWKFALAFLLSIYIHEMGHVAALRRYGLPASAPAFIPGFGAFVRMKQMPATAREDARIGLAGPVWGLGASLCALALSAATGNALWAAVARAGAFVNLFNLFPVWQLDGSRGIRSLARMQVGLLALLSALMWLILNVGMLILLAILLAWRAYTRKVDQEPDWRGTMEFGGLIVALSLLGMIPLPEAG